jgi:hypothetical protein
MQLYHKMALCVANIAKLTLNVLDNGDAAPCPFSLVVQSQTHSRCCPLWMDGTLFISPHISKYLPWMIRCLRTWLLFMSWRNSKQSNGVEPFGGLLKSTLDDLLRSDCDYLQLS